MVTVGGIVSGMAWNVAVTVFVAVTATVHCVPAAESHPLQLPKVEFVSGTAVSPTVAPLANRAEQLEPQVIPEGALLTVPDPVPALTTERAKAPGSASRATPPSRPRGPGREPSCRSRSPCRPLDRYRPPRPCRCRCSRLRRHSTEPRHNPQACSRLARN